MKVPGMKVPGERLMRNGPSWERKPIGSCRKQLPLGKNWLEPAHHILKSGPEGFQDMYPWIPHLADSQGPVSSHLPPWYWSHATGSTLWPHPQTVMIRSEVVSWPKKTKSESPWEECPPPKQGQEFPPFFFFSPILHNTISQVPKIKPGCLRHLVFF